MTLRSIEGGRQSREPCDLEAERSTLGWLLTHHAEGVAVQLGPADFFGESHRLVWSTLAALAANGTAHDTAAVGDELERHGKLGQARVGGLTGREALLELTEGIPEDRSVRLREMRVARSTFAHARRIAEAAERGNLTEALAAASAAAHSITAATAPTAAPKVPGHSPLHEMIFTSLRPIGQRLSTGLETLDDATRGGIPLGRVVAVLGAPGAGKSTYAVQLADRWERAGAAVVYLAADEPAEGIITRLGQLDGFSREALEEDGLEGERARVEYMQRSEGRSLIVIDPEADGSASTIEDASAVLDHVAADRPRVLIVDSLQTARCAAAELAESARERIDVKMAVLKAIAKRGTLVIVISEMARSGYRSGDRNQDTSALAAGKESGGIEYAVSLLIGLRSVKGEHGQVDVEVAKNRLGGAKPELRMLLDSERASFAEVAMPDREEQKAKAGEQRNAEVEEKIRQAVLRHGRAITSKTKLITASGVRKADGLRAIDQMEIAGELTQNESGAYELVQWERPL